MTNTIINFAPKSTLFSSFVKPQAFVNRKNRNQDLFKPSFKESEKSNNRIRGLAMLLSSILAISSGYLWYKTAEEVANNVETIQDAEKAFVKDKLGKLSKEQTKSLKEIFEQNKEQIFSSLKINPNSTTAMELVDHINKLTTKMDDELIPQLQQARSKEVAIDAIKKFLLCIGVPPYEQKVILADITPNIEKFIELKNNAKTENVNLENLYSYGSGIFLGILLFLIRSEYKSQQNKENKI